jgi:hypothetical protein
MPAVYVYSSMQQDLLTSLEYSYEYFQLLHHRLFQLKAFLNSILTYRIVGNFELN